MSFACSPLALYFSQYSFIGPSRSTVGMGQDPIPDVHLSFISINMFLVELEKVKNITETAKLIDFFFGTKKSIHKYSAPCHTCNCPFFYLRFYVNILVKSNQGRLLKTISCRGLVVFMQSRTRLINQYDISLSTVNFNLGTVPQCSSHSCITYRS